MYTPINEGEGSYYGFPYGLGTTEAHLTNAPSIAPIGGKVLMVMTGASTQKQIGDRVATKAATLTNPQFKFANLSIAAKDLNDWLTETVWTSAMTNLAGKGHTPEQVQILVIQNDDLSDPSTIFPTRATNVEGKFKEVINKHLEKFPNLKQIFIIGRLTTLWTTDTKHAEPKAYYNGWACKFVTQDSVSGAYTPWVCDSIYMFTDGDAPNSNGLNVLQSDFKTDGIHLSAAGKTKVGDWLHNQLRVHSVTSLYYY